MKSVTKKQIKELIIYVEDHVSCLLIGYLAWNRLKEVHKLRSLFQEEYLYFFNIMVTNKRFDVKILLNLMIKRKLKRKRKNNLWGLRKIGIQVSTRVWLSTASPTIKIYIARPGFNQTQMTGISEKSGFKGTTLKRVSMR